jgi:hypothetical protein
MDEGAAGSIGVSGSAVGNSADASITDWRMGTRRPSPPAPPWIVVAPDEMLGVCLEPTRFGRVAADATLDVCDPPDMCDRVPR